MQAFLTKPRAQQLFLTGGRLDGNPPLQSHNKWPEAQRDIYWGGRKWLCRSITREIRQRVVKHTEDPGPSAGATPTPGRVWQLRKKLAAGGSRGES